MKSFSAPHRIAIIHDWLYSHRGGERILEALCELYPAAEIFTLFHTPGSAGEIIESHPIHTSILNQLPLNKRYYRYLLPLFPLAMERFDLSAFDLVISSSHCVAKGVIVNPRAIHLCYCHTPMRYAWDRYDDYFANRWIEPLVFPLMHYMRIWDSASSARVDHFIANSYWVQSRIEKYYRRSSEVVYPFVDLKNFRPIHQENPWGEYYLIVSAFAPYKRIDLAIKACKKLDRKLWVVGDGQEKARLKLMAGEKTKFLGRVSGEKLLSVFSNAKAFLFPGEEDFGITPLESMACGKPVIAFGRGGTLETIVDGKTGLFFAEQTVDSLSQAILEFESKAHQFSHEVCRQQAEQFSKERFKKDFCRTVNRLYEETRKKATAGKHTKPLSVNDSKPALENPLGNC